MDAEEKGGGLGQPAKEEVTAIGFGPRLAATAIDGAIVGFSSFVLGTAVGVVVGLIQAYTPNTDVPVNAYIIIAGLALSIVYYAGSWANSGQTIGNMLFGLKVVGVDGEPVHWGKALLRFLGYILSAACLSLGFLWINFDKKRQGWHDKIAGTYVIKIEDKFSDAHTVDFVPSDPKRGWVWLIVWIVIAIIAPGALFAAILALGPFVAAAVNSIVRGFGG